MHGAYGQHQLVNGFVLGEEPGATGFDGGERNSVVGERRQDDDLGLRACRGIRVTSAVPSPSGSW